MEPWITDAGNITINKDTKSYLLTNSRIEKFLQVGPHEKNFFLIGAKGLGKTLFLKYKRYLYQNGNNSGSFKFHPSGEEMCENLILDYSDISKEDLLKYQDHKLWERIWLFCLSTVICKAGNVEIPENILSLCPTPIRVSTALNMLLKNRKSILEILNSNLDILLTQILSIESGVLVFIDNLDQELENILHGQHTSDFVESGSHPAIKVWVNAQFGLMSAVYKISKANSHIKIYTSIRREAYENISNSLRANYESYSTLLEYSKDEVRAIFDKNIQQMDEDDLAENRRSNSLLRKFLGFEQMPHSFAKKNGIKIPEDAFDFIYRHTFGRPREIVLIGKDIYHFIKSSRNYASDGEKIEKIRKLVNAISNDLFYQYQSEIIPNFDLIKLEEFVNSVRKNVIPQIAIQELNQDIIKLYYNIGLIGCTVEKNHQTDELVQRFLPPARYNYMSLDSLPNADYFVTHPSMDEDLRLKYRGSFYNKQNIIGDGYPFNLPDHNEAKGLIVHFGAGKLTLGLVIPLLSSRNGSTVIVQRKSSAFWSDVTSRIKNRKIDILRNGKKAFSLEIYTENNLQSSSEICQALDA